MKGSAKAIEKASIVRIGDQNSPAVDLISTEPTIGPVHENDTNTSVRARKKIPPRPFESAFESLLLTSHEGIVISNAPKNEAAKTMLDDAITAGEEVSIVVRVEWVSEGQGKYKNFTFTEDADLVADYLSDWDNKMFTLTISDLTGISDLACTAYVVANGVTVEA